jgi:hypothetical protein
MARTEQCSVPTPGEVTLAYAQKLISIVIEDVVGDCANEHFPAQADIACVRSCGPATALMALRAAAFDHCLAKRSMKRLVVL